MHRNLSMALFVCALLARVASAGDLSIHLFDYKLQPNQPHQTIPIFIHSLAGGEQVQGLDFRVLIGDGGEIVGGHDPGPFISGDIIGPGTLFHSNINGVPAPGPDDPNVPGYIDIGTVVTSGSISVPAGDTVLGFIDVDTTGFSAGRSWDMILTNLFEQSIGPGYSTTLIGGDPLQLLVNTGSVTIVPEPSGGALAVLGLTGLLAWAWLKRIA